MERKMKDSGIPWIGAIPEHWKIARIKDIYSFQTGATPPSKTESFYDGDNLWANIGDIDGKTIFETSKHLSDEGVSVCSMNISPKGSLLYSFKLSVGQVAFCGVDMYTNEAIATFIGEPTALSYLYYVAPLFIVFNANTNIYGAPILNQDLIKNAIIPVPPLAEQERIASYLDEKCGEIDELIEVEQQMISDLESYRQAVITEAVTHGLNPNAPKKQSTIQGIKDIPFNWNEVNLLKVIYLRARLGWRGLKAEEYVDEGYPFLSAFNIVNNQLVWENLNFINQLRYDESPEIKLSLHDILIVKDGAGIGKCARVENMPLGESTVNSSLGVITVSETLYYSYLYYFFLSTPFQDNVLFLKNGMGVPHLTQENLKSVRIPLPPVDEQKAIANFLDSKCFEIDGLIKVKQEKIETLKQYRQSLIFEAVTGKTLITNNA